MDYADVTDSVLYYPTIEFQDEVWIKSALCVWYLIYRIVPEEYRPCDSYAVAEAAAAGAIVDLNISRADLEKCASAFEQFWETVPVIPAGVEGWLRFSSPVADLATIRAKKRMAVVRAPVRMPAPLLCILFLTASGTGFPSSFS